MQAATLGKLLLGATAAGATLLAAAAPKRYGVTSLAKGAEAQANTVRKHMNSVQRAPQKSPQEVELEPAIDLDGLESYESIFPAWHHTKRLLSAKRQDSS